LLILDAISKYLPFEKTHSMVCAMDFRDTHCIWCTLKSGPIENCIKCPRFRKYELEEDILFDSSAFCGQCRNNQESDLKVFCETNRRLQQDADEDFDCYKFFPDFKGAEAGQVHVVTVFPCNRGRICLVRRSRNVGTYQDLWSGISGYLEGEPVKHFKVELQEETSLNPGEYTLLRQAETVVIQDERQSCTWCVHPFLCEVNDPSRISLDWENTECRWFLPEEIDGLDTVPALKEVYERVSRLPLEKEVFRFVQELKNDHESGARQLAYKALVFLAGAARSSNAARAVTLLDDLFYACHEIAAARPSMAMISTTLDLLQRDMKVVASLGVREAISEISSLIRGHIREMDASLDMAVKHLERVIPLGSTILLNSYSSSLIHALPMLKDKQCSLIVTESRPGFEGRVTAGVAVDMGLPVRVITDACAAEELRKVDLVLMGVDTIELDGSVVNTAGSSLIAMAAHALSVKVYFMGEIRKISISGKRVDLEEYDPAEVWDDPPKGQGIRNLYFDRTSPGFITGIVLEKGIAQPDEIGEIARSMLAF
jgi:translation initiation factor 2B subunit (eIF-2B alpha/beta/delta family)